MKSRLTVYLILCPEWGVFKAVIMITLDKYIEY